MALNPQQYLDRLNAIEVRPADLENALNEQLALGKTAPNDFGQISITKVSFALREPIREPNAELAVTFRMLSLFRLLGRNENYGWQFPADGGDWPQAVFAAAASQPIILFGEEIGFEPETFASTVRAFSAQ